MSLDFEKYELGDLCNILSSKRIFAREYVDSGVPFYRGKEIIELYNNREVSNELFITNEKYLSIKEKYGVPKEGDILLSSVGTLGIPFLVNNEKFYFKDGNLTWFKDFDSKIYNKFLFWWFQSPDAIFQINNKCIGSTQKALTIRILEKFEINLPPLAKQKKIVTLLENISNKIKVNISINNNLEEQILKIFNSWFVKFDKSEELTDSHLGLIPKGWTVDYLGSKKSCSIIGSGIDDFDDSKIYIATADVENSSITNNETLITMEDKPSRANMQPISKSIWFAKMIETRKLIMVDDYSTDLLDNYIFSTGFCGLKCVDKYFYYLWTFLLTDAFDTIKNNFCTGTTMQAINNKDTKLIEFVLPDDEILNKFNLIAKPLFKKIYYNNQEINQLQNLRDTLLPKLMSGEIDVSKINCDLD